MNIKKVFCALLLTSSLVFALPASANNNVNAPGLKEKTKIIKEDLRIRKMGMLERMCEVRREINSRLPKFKVPKICNKPSLESPKLEFSVSSLTINEGESALLVWEAENALSCEASEGWSGEKNVLGEENVSPLVTTEYTLTCDGVEEGIEKSVILEVLPLPDPEPIDVCQNIPDLQETIPVGYHKEGEDCVEDVVVPPPPVPNFDHIIMSEVFYKGVSSLEWVELYNDTGSDVDLSGWNIADSVSSDELPNVVIPNNKFAIIVGSTFDVSSLSLPVDTVVITLVGTNIGSGLNDTGAESVTLSNGVSTVDSLTYGTGEGAVPHVTAGQSVVRKVPFVDTDLASDWEGATPTPGQ